MPLIETVSQTFSRLVGQKPELSPRQKEEADKREKADQKLFATMPRRLAARDAAFKKHRETEAAYERGDVPQNKLLHANRALRLSLSDLADAVRAGERLSAANQNPGYQQAKQAAKDQIGQLRDDHDALAKSLGDEESALADAASRLKSYRRAFEDRRRTMNPIEIDRHERELDRLEENIERRAETLALAHKRLPELKADLHAAVDHLKRVRAAGAYGDDWEKELAKASA